MCRNTDSRRGIALTVISAAFLILSCSPFTALKERFARPRLEFLGMRTGEISPSGFQLLVDLSIKNTGTESLKIVGYSYKAEINHSPFAKGEDSTATELPPLGEVQVAVPVTVTYRDLKRALSGIDWLQGGIERTMITVSGIVTARRLGLDIPIPFSVSRPLRSLTKGLMRQAPQASSESESK